MMALMLSTIALIKMFQTMIAAITTVETMQLSDRGCRAGLLQK
jgi:hypothetical protein